MIDFLILTMIFALQQMKNFFSYFSFQFCFHPFKKWSQFECISKVFKLMQKNIIIIYFFLMRKVLSIKRRLFLPHKSSLCMWMWNITNKTDSSTYRKNAKKKNGGWNVHKYYKKLRHISKHGEVFSVLIVPFAAHHWIWAYAMYVCCFNY